jgi:predicted nucleic acid-binding protein
MNGDKYFVDSNVLLYLFDQLDQAKRDRAEAWLARLWGDSRGALSWQVIQEFYWNALRKYRAQPEQARDYVRLMSQWKPPIVTLDLIERAWHWSDHAQLTFWDGMIVAAAELTGCRFLLSDDFQAGQRFDSVTVINPFDTPPPATARHARPV